MYVDQHSPEKPDLDNPERIGCFVEAFYERLLKDQALAPIFLEVAAIDIHEHFPRIQAYWEKLLLGGQDYHRHTMNIHRALHHKRPLTRADFDLWLSYFTQTMDENFAGPYAERAKRIAATIANNMHRALNGP